MLPWLLQDPSAIDDIKSAVDNTSQSSYAYRVGGRFVREGVFTPPDLLTARIDGFQSARNGTKILIKGPEGLWKTPDERIGEQVEGTPAVVADKVATLREAERPHRMLSELLADVKGAPARVASGEYRLAYDPEKVRAYLQKEIEKAVERKTLDKPDQISWETASGTLRVHVARPAGTILKFSDERSVSIGYRRGEGAVERRRYRTEMEFELSAHGTAKIELPDEVKEKLGIK
jgi:hypothetical protein